MSLITLISRSLMLALLLIAFSMVRGPIWRDTPFAVIAQPGAWIGIMLVGEGHDCVNLVGILFGELIFFSIAFFLVQVVQVVTALGDGVELLRTEVARFSHGRSKARERPMLDGECLE